MKRLLIVSNRLPINVEKHRDKIRFKQSVGGLATGLKSFYKLYNSVWIGWPGITTEEIGKTDNITKKLRSKFHCYPVYLSGKDVNEYYNGFCNKTIWPLFHYFPQYTTYNEGLWESYIRVNKIFCDSLLEVVEEHDMIWIHDYHLMLLPQLICEKIPNTTIGFFLHTPFPSSEIFRLLPFRNQILEGMLGSDLLGFHTYDYARHFLSSIRTILGIEHTFGQIQTEDYFLKVDVFPMGIDYKRFASAASNKNVQKRKRVFHKRLGNRKIILSIVRLDYSIGILQRLKAFDLFLHENPEFKEKASLILVAVPSRGEVEEYQLLKQQIDELVGQINGKYGTIGWTPIFYLYRVLSFETLIALYSLADVALITPLRDGMNLMAKEFLATKRNEGSVLILSEMAGASEELGEAIIINPNDKRMISDALKEAFSLTDKEIRRRTKELQKRLKRYTVERWAKDFIDNLVSVKELQHELDTKRLIENRKQTIIDKYHKTESNERLLLLDYDGTLTSFASTPEKAKPDKRLLKLLKKLADESEVILISGRKKNSLEKWFGKLNVGLVAEHGTWLKEKGKSWELLEPLRNEWKEEIRPILEVYVDRTPRSFIEEKSFSLVWHYRRADPELSYIRAKELSDTLTYLIADSDLGVLEGNKVIEVKNTSITKGKAALHWISKKTWNFILAVGDDITDEDTFSVLPETAYSIKIGLGSSHAQYNLRTPQELREILHDFIA